MSLSFIKHHTYSIRTFETVERIVAKQSSVFTPHTKVEAAKNSPHSVTAAIPMPIISGKTQLASLTLTLPLGSRYEDINYQGYSHLLRSMAFKVHVNILFIQSQLKI